MSVSGREKIKNIQVKIISSEKKFCWYPERRKMCIKIKKDEIMLPIAKWALLTIRTGLDSHKCELDISLFPP